MNDARPHPFTLVFGELAPLRFPAVREALGDDPALDEFLLAPPVIELLRDLRPDEGLGDAVDPFVAFVHAAYRYWASGAQTNALDESATRHVCGESPAGRGGSTGAGQPSLLRPAPHAPLVRPARTGTSYTQIAPRLVWVRLADAETFEPLDGWFITRDGPELDVVACLGVHAERPGLSIVTARGAAPGAIVRDDGSAVFSPTMPGGDAAGLHAVSSVDELLLLVRRAEEEVPGWP